MMLYARKKLANMLLLLWERYFWGGAPVFWEMGGFVVHLQLFCLVYDEWFFQILGGGLDGCVRRTAVCGGGYHF